MRQILSSANKVRSDLGRFTARKPADEDQETFRNKPGKGTRSSFRRGAYTWRMAWLRFCYRDADTRFSGILGQFRGHLIRLEI